MYQKNCVWHRCCRNEYSDTLTERLLKQHKKENPAPPEPVPQPDEQTPKRARVRFQNTLCIYCQRDTSEHLFNVTQLNWGEEHLSMARGLLEGQYIFKFIV